MKKLFDSIKKNKRTVLTLCGVVLIVIGLVLLLIFSKGCSPFKKGQPIVTETKASTEKRETLPPETEPVKEPYKSPVDFEALEEENPEIIGWISITGTDISYPIYQRPGDDGFYLNHNRKGKYDAFGEIYSEATYNSADFSDPVTLLYGHNPGNKTMFGKLQTIFADAEMAEKNPEIIIYMKNCEYHYTVFCSTTFDNRHIMYSYNFNDEDIYKSFFEQIKSTRSMDTYFNEEIFEQGNGHNIILSTCKNGNNNKRFLVMACVTEVID